MKRYYYPSIESVEENKKLILSGQELKEDNLIPSLDGRFTHFRYFKHNVDIVPSKDAGEKIVISSDEIDKVLSEGKVALIPYTVPFERSYAIVELQDLTSEKRITNLLYDAVYEGIPISDLKIGLEIVSLRVLEAVKSGFSKIILSDFNMSDFRIPVPITFLLMYLERFLKENNVSIKDLELTVQSWEIQNPFEIATLIALGTVKVSPLALQEKEVIDLLNAYIKDLSEKKGYSQVYEFVGSKDLSIVGLKNEFLENINPSYKSTFEVEGLPEIESYIYYSK
jgi:glutamate synthase (NADPH/NADH) large chain